MSFRRRKDAIFSYGFKDGKLDNSSANGMIENKHIINSITQNYRHYKLPVTLDPLKYGKLLDTVEISTDNIKYYIQVTPLTLFVINQTLKNDGVLVTLNVRIIEKMYTDFISEFSLSK